MNITEVIDHTGLNKKELAALYAVSRQTIHTWVTKPAPEGSLSARMADAITAALLSAVKYKVLPLPSMSVKARRERVARMAANLQDIKPAPAKQ